METREVEAGEVIFNEGDESSEAFRIASGKVEICVNTPAGMRSVAQLREGEIFGEMGLADDKPRSATARALQKTTLQVITAENFSEIILNDEAALTGYLATLIERLRTTDALLQIALRQNATDAESARSYELSLREGAPADVPAADVPAAPPAYTEYRVLLASSYEPGKWRGDRIAAEIEKYPYRIGCQFVGPPPPFMRNDLLVRDTLPAHVSRDHCAIERNADGIFVRDRGSTEGTIVNAQAIGMRAGTLSAPLNLGENILILGGADSPHRFFVNVVAVE